jgi:hypothetical protein
MNGGEVFADGIFVYLRGQPGNMGAQAVFRKRGAPGIGLFRIFRRGNPAAENIDNE